MRSGCAVQQALTSDAAAVVKQAAVLAKRRGHAQVTPLHVATTMLSATTSAAAGGGATLLRSACLKSQSISHPLQCKALELCFNVALNRLPTAAGNPIQRRHHPSISNALLAAFKRAQAHRRRGGAAADNQPILTVKIELEQLVVSILDDPSVSRVMREAGFSSTHVKINVEKAASMESEENSASIDNDCNVIIEELVASKRRRRSFVVVGERISDVEAAAKEAMNRVDRDGLTQLKFVTFPPFFSLCNAGRDRVLQKVEELRFLVDNHAGEGVVLYLGDLDWISEYRVSLEREREGERSCYPSVEHVIMELGRLVSDIAINGENGRFWLMGIANFQTYMRCRNGCNSLEKVWCLHPVTIPDNTLGLSLVSRRDEDDDHRSSKCEEEAQKLRRLPSWLKLDENRPLSNYNDQNCVSELFKNCNSTGTLPSSSSASSSTSCFSFDQLNPNLHQAHFSLNSSSSTQNFKEFNAKNLNTLCNLLEEKVPWQRQIIQEVSGTILQCRSGMLRRRQDVVTWFFFLGPDARAKDAIAVNLADIIFGSSSNFVSIELDRDGVERFAREVSVNPHRVFLLKDLERVDRSRRMRMKRAIERGRISDGNGVEFCLFDAIVVLSCEKFSSGDGGGGEGGSGGVSLDLNMSFCGDSVENMMSFDDLGILEIVDRVVVFNFQD